MRYTDFRKKVERLPIITSAILTHIGGKPQSVRNQLTRWYQRGLLVKLRRGLSVLNEPDRKITPTRVYIANQLYPPSYVSTEYALSFYGLIPEQVADVTSVTPRKTYSFTNAFGTFAYQRIIPGAFRGYVSEKDENGSPYLIASPEKALADFFYLNLDRFNANDADVFEESYRIQNTDILDFVGLKKFARLFNSAKLTAVVQAFCNRYARRKR